MEGKRWIFRTIGTLSRIPPKKLVELRRRFMEEWRSGKYTKSK